MTVALEPSDEYAYPHKLPVLELQLSLDELDQQLQRQ